EDNKDYLILKGVGSFQAWYYISLCQEELGKKEEAVISIMRSLLIAPQYKVALETLARFMSVKEISVDEYINKHFSGEIQIELKNIIRKLEHK
ncbi:MAG TPA: hypothetical protein VK190_12885, partial [Pseudoneobacillus sp.]|nr:hypothetical protein [Pseudoneobacillus sp.]